MCINTRMGAGHTRDRVIDAAEQLIAEHGVGGVSLRQIAKVAGEGNHGVVQYHFGSKDGLIDAVLRRRAELVDPPRLAMLDALVSEERTDDLRALVEAAVCPLADLVGVEGPGGADYLLFIGEVQSVRARSFPLVLDGLGTRGLLRVRDLIRECLPEMPEALLDERVNLMVVYVISALVTQVRSLRSPIESERPLLDTATFVGNLVDTVVAALSAPVSAETEETFRQQSEQAA